MEMRKIRLSAAVLFVAGWGVSVSAQSLADVARKEEARRKHVAKPARVLTNKDLKPSEIPISPAGSDQTAPAADGAKPDAPKVTDEPQDQQDRDEQAWRDRMAKARGDLEHSEMYLDALQSKINSLWADFTSRDDPAQRAVIEADRKKALAEFDRVKQQVQDQKKAIDDLEEEARKAGVPPGWLR
jgi:uncharacterized protein (DUF3084 family)